MNVSNKALPKVCKSTRIFKALMQFRLKTNSCQLSIRCQTSTACVGRDARNKKLRLLVHVKALSYSFKIAGLFPCWLWSGQFSWDACKLSSTKPVRKSTNVQWQRGKRNAGIILRVLFKRHRRNASVPSTF